MRHHNKNKKFGRVKNQRKALIDSLVRALIKHEKIETTEVRAKAIRSFVEKLITEGRKGDLSARRLVYRRLRNNGEVGKKVFETLSPRYASRKGGYTRIIKSRRRMSDGSPMAIIEFVK